MNNKKTMKLVLAAVALLGGLTLASCGGNNNDNSSETSRVSTHFQGSGEPDVSLGKDGDTYTDTKNNVSYTKVNGAWVKDSDSNHFEGVGKPDNAVGKDGDTYTDTSTGAVYTKQNGYWVKTKEGESVNKVTVTFDLNGGIMSNGDATITPQTIDYGSWVLDPGTPTKTHCNFLGWYAGTAKWDFNTPVYKDLTLVAKWSVNEDEKVTITIDPNNGGEKYTVDTFEGDSPRLDIPTKEGYSFKGWYIDGQESKPWTGIVRADELNGHTIIALFDKSAFNFKFKTNEDGTLTITGLLNINSALADVPSSIGGKKVTAIGETAFQSRVSLIQVNIPDSVTSIDPRAFLGARKLSTILVSGSNIAYKSDNGVLYSRDGNTLVYCPPKNTQSTFDVPAGVTKIGDYAFYGQGDEGITGVNFKEGLVEIGNRAFYGINSSSFTSVSFPNSLKKIGDYAFAYVASSSEGMLQQITTWGTGVEEIGYAAFFGQYFKNEFVVPSSVKIIRERAFSNCSAITKITLPAGIELVEPGFAAYAQGVMEIAIAGTGANEHYKVENNTLYSADGKILVYSPANRTDTSSIEVPAGVTQIADYAFYCSKFVESITLPNTVTSLGKESFREVYKLNNFVMPNSVLTMGEDCFSGCTLMTNFTIGTGLTRLPRYSLSETGLTQINIPSNIVSIDDSVFYNCTKLATINFSEGLEEIGAAAFYISAYTGDEEIATAQQGSIRTLDFPLSLKKIGNRAFSNQTKLTSVKFGNIEEIGSAIFDNATSLSRISKKSGATTIEIDDASILYTANHKKLLFAITNGLTGELTMNNATEEIAPYAFYGCKEITKITLPSGLKKIGEGAFESAVKSSDNVDWKLLIPASVTEIGEAAFRFTNKVSELEFEAGSELKTIGKDAFCMLNITSVTLPDSLETIGESAFSSSLKLTSLTLGKGLKSIGAEAFVRCRSLKGNVTLPKTLTSIGANAFGDTQIEGFTLEEGSTSFALENGFLMDQGKEHLIAFLGKKEMTNISLPSSIKYIDDYAMAGTSAKVVNLPSGLLSIGEFAFMDAREIRLLDIPASVTNIGANAFRGWSSSQQIKIHKSQEAAAIAYDDEYLNSCYAAVTYVAE